MKKKYTIRDIAKQAGVSVATVSYIINDRKDQRISEDTRKKVLQIINLLDYKPNSSAKSLATNKTYHVALYLAEETSLYKRSEQLRMAEALASTLAHHGYHLLLQNSKSIDAIDYADAILCLDATEEQFLAIGDKNLIPLLAIDCQTSIPWFFQICTDYARIKEQADRHFCHSDYSFVCLAPNNAFIKERITSTFSSVIFLDDSTVVDSLSGNLVYSQASLQTVLSASSAFYVQEDLMSKAEKVYNCICLAIDRVPDLEHRVYTL